MSFYVKRQQGNGRVGWVGPIRSFRQSQREFVAWVNSGWDATIYESTPAIRREVREWQRERNIAHGRVAS